MNIVLVTESDDPVTSGVVRSVLAIAAEFRRQGHRVLLISPGTAAEKESIEFESLRLPMLRPFEDGAVSLPLSWSESAVQTLEKFRPDIVHSHDPFTLSAAAVRIASQYSAPLVFTYHFRYDREAWMIPGHWSTLKGLAGEQAIAYCRLADAVFVPNPGVAAFLQGRGVHTPPEIVPPGIERFTADVDQRSTLREELGLPADAFVLGHAGRFGTDDHSQILARNIREFVRRERRAHFLQFGPNEPSDEFRALFADRDIAARTHAVRIERIDELARVYSSMDAYLIGSRFTSHAIEALEVMSLGVPVVAVDGPAVREFLRPGENGWVLNSDRKREFVDTLRGAASNSMDERSRLAESARATAERHAASQSAQRTLELYENLRKSTRQPKPEQLSVWESVSRRLSTEFQLWTSRGQAATAALGRGRHPSRVPGLRHLINGWRWCRHWFSRREWSVKLLNLPVSRGTADEPGLILIQIDGLSRPSLERALRAGRMPFVKKLLEREYHRLHTMYSGQPTTTPAVLAELFYGVEQKVPAFGFRDHRTDEEVRMYHPSTAARIQQELERAGDGLLSEGSAYCDIYSGGADESSFCPATTGWRNMEDVTMWRRIALFGMNVMSLARIFGSALVELGVGIAHCFPGIRNWTEYKEELLYIPRRVIVNTVLRDLVAISVEADATRGVPVVHANLLGYDENSHRRGPDSWFAQQALRGIDRTVRRIWNAAHASLRRDYQVWIMADHGQEKTEPYSFREGRSVQDAVNAVYCGAGCPEPVRPKHRPRSPEIESASWLRTRRATDEKEKRVEPRDATELPLTIAVGPLGYINWPTAINDSEKPAIAERLVREAQLPIVMTSIDGTVWAWNRHGRYRMPEQADRVLAPDHPHLPQVAEDLTKLCFHPDGGDFVISGWDNDRPPMSFVAEAGAHGGPGPRETSGFCIVPPDAPLPEGEHGVFRPLTLRGMAQKVLHRAPVRRTDAYAARVPSVVRIVTYNVHSCVGLDGRLSPLRIARVLAATAPDIVALQEVDVMRSRSAFAHQAEQIARYLNMELKFHPSFEIEEGRYGNAILSRFPLEVVHAAPLPILNRRQEPRGAVWVRVDLGKSKLNVITSHLGLSSAERRLQIDALLGEDWLGHPDCRDPRILCGDMNLLPRSKAYKQITSQLRDVQMSIERYQPQRTWFAPFPLTRIDHVFVGPDLAVKQIEIPRTRLARVASDHLPLVVDLEVPNEPVAAPHFPSSPKTVREAAKQRT